MKKQWLSIVLVLCMVLCLAPTTARAAESEMGTLAITVNVWGLDEGVDAGGKTFSFEIRRQYAGGSVEYTTATIIIKPGETTRTENVQVPVGVYDVKQTHRDTIDGYDSGSVTYAGGNTPNYLWEVFENKSTQVTVNNHYKKALTNEITALPIKVTGYALGAKVSDIKASTEDQMRVAINKVTIKRRNASGGWDDLAPDATIQADTQYAVEILVNAKSGYTYAGLIGDNVTVNGETASKFENPSTQSGGDMRVFHELDVLEAVKPVDHIEITTPPTKTVYNAGDKFEPAGMVVTAVYKDGTSEPITNYSIFHGDKLTKGQEYVTIQYNDGSGNSDIKVRQSITVGPYVGDHQHTYDDSWYADTESHWHWCTDKDCPDRNGSTKDLARHTFVWKVDKAATRTQTGLKHEECTVCHYKRNENTEIPTLSGHRPATRPDSGAENTVITSAKTGDAGIALYAGLSLLALSGSGWAVGKKRRGEK